VIKIKLTGKALRDLAVGNVFYEDQESGLGDYFASCLESDIEGLKVTAGIHRQTHADYHRLISRVFPYAIYYTFSDETAVIWAVVDCRRDPKWIRCHLAE
jgi:hypothetical protein